MIFLPSNSEYGCEVYWFQFKPSPRPEAWRLFPLCTIVSHMLKSAFLNKNYFQ